MRDDVCLASSRRTLWKDTETRAMSVRAISSISSGEARLRLPVRAGGIARLPLAQVVLLHRQMPGSASAGCAAAPPVLCPLHTAVLTDLLTPH